MAEEHKSGGAQNEGKKLTRISGTRFGDPLRNFTDRQLTWIGAIAMVFNEIEWRMHHLVAACVQYPGSFYELTSRVTGIDNMHGIIESAIMHFDLSDTIRAQITASLTRQGLTDLKVYRDLIVHARMFDIHTSVGTGPVKRGRFDYILLSDIALEGICRRLALLHDELIDITKIVDNAAYIKWHRDIDDQHRAILESNIEDASRSIQAHQSNRASLPPLPKLPEGSELVFQVHPHPGPPPEWRDE
jgi:hypothetical protein